VEETAQALSLAQTPDVPYPPGKAEPPVTTAESSTAAKRKASEPGENDEVAGATTALADGVDSEGAKKAKTDAVDGVTNGNVEMNEQAGQGQAQALALAQARQAALARSFFSVLDPESLKAPVMPSVEEMGRVLLEVRKNALREEYGV
jgi:pre-mRNA-splicing factor ISY1